jgi:hypothetical protein
MVVLNDRQITRIVVIAYTRKDQKSLGGFKISLVCLKLSEVMQKQGLIVCPLPLSVSIALVSK